MLPSLVTLLLLPVLIGLGIWQLQRAEYKTALQAEYDARSQGPAVAVASELQPAEALRYYRVAAKGVYEPAYQILVDNRVHRGQAGYHVVTPLHLQGGAARILVNRGWVAAGPDRSQLPPIDVPPGLVEVHGVAVEPGDRHFTLAAPEPIRDVWPTVWQNLDMKRYAAAVPFPVQPVVILLDPSAPAGGFVRDWARLDTGIATHRGYAFQWFSLAAALAVIYLVVNLRRRSENFRHD